MRQSPEKFAYDSSVYDRYEITPSAGLIDGEKRKQSLSHTIDVCLKLCREYGEVESQFNETDNPYASSGYIKKLAEKIIQENGLDDAAEDKEQRRQTAEKLVEAITTICRMKKNFEFMQDKKNTQFDQDTKTSAARLEISKSAGETSSCNLADDVYEIIRQTRKLPSPPAVMLKIIKLAGNDESSKEDIARVAGEDPALAGRIIKYVNSPFAGQAKNVASVFEAVNLLGIETVKNLALGVSLVSQCNKGPCVKFDYGRFWSESTAQATAACHLAAVKFQGIDKEVAFTAGLLCQIGRLALATAYPGEYAQLLNRMVSKDSARICEPEQETFGIDHNELAARMMAEWNLPEYFCQAILLQDSLTKIKQLPSDSPELSLVRILRWARIMSAIFMQPSRVPRNILHGTIAVAGTLGISAQNFPQSFDSIAYEWSQMGSIFEINTPEVPSWYKIYAQAG